MSCGTHSHTVGTEFLTSRTVQAVNQRNLVLASSLSQTASFLSCSAALLALISYARALQAEAWVASEAKNYEYAYKLSKQVYKLLDSFAKQIDLTSFADDYRRLNELVIEAMGNACDSLVRLERFTEALREANKAIAYARSKDMIETSVMAAFAFANRAEAHHKLYNYAKAKKDYEKALELYHKLEPNAELLPVIKEDLAHLMVDIAKAEMT